MKKWCLPVVTLAALSLSAGSAQAQRFGAQLNWADDVDLGIGVRIEAPVGLATQGVLSRTYVIGSFDYYFDCGDDCTYFEFNGNIAAPVSPASSVNPYLGAGINMARASVGDESNTDLGLNLLGGLKFAISSLAAFTEAKFEVGGGEQLVLTFGLLFGR